MRILWGFQPGQASIATQRTEFVQGPGKGLDCASPFNTGGAYVDLEIGGVVHRHSVRPLPIPLARAMSGTLRLDQSAPMGAGPRPRAQSTSPKRWPRRHTPGRKSAALHAVARATEQLQILRFATSPHRHRDDVVELQLGGRTAVTAASAITLPDVLLNLVGNVAATRRDRCRTPLHRRDGAIDLALVPLIARDQ